MRVILISGKAGHGKDTVAGFLKQAMEAEGKRVLITHYADLLKHICKSFFGWNGEKDEAGREMLQKIGTECIRAQDPDFLVDFVIQILRFFLDQWDYVLIPDARFPNEIQRMRDCFPCTHIKVFREDYESPLTPEQQAHPSETAMDHINPDYEIISHEDNLESLRDTVKVCWDYIWREERP